MISNVHMDGCAQESLNDGAAGLDWTVDLAITNGALYHWATAAHLAKLERKTPSGKWLARDFMEWT